MCFLFVFLGGRLVLFDGAILWLENFVGYLRREEMPLEGDHWTVNLWKISPLYWGEILEVLIKHCCVMVFCLSSIVETFVVRVSYAPLWITESESVILNYLIKSPAILVEEKRLMELSYIFVNLKKIGSPCLVGS